MYIYICIYVSIYICMYIYMYQSHFNCVGAVSVVSYKTNQEGASKKWWFVIRGDKHNLEILEKEWSKYPTQIGWKLDPAFCYDNSGIVSAQLMMLIVNTNSTSTD